MLPFWSSAHFYITLILKRTNWTQIMAKKFLIIGTSAAGIGAAVKLRSLDDSIDITCITAEVEMPYNRCLLADFVAGEKSLTQVSTKTQEFFDQNRITLMLNSRAVKIDPTNNQVVLESGKRLEYDMLFLGTGRVSRKLEIPGSDAAGVFSFYDLRDSTNIFDYTKNNSIKHATVIGAGLSGLECADALRGQNIAVSLIEMSPQVLAAQINKTGSDFLIKHMSKNYNVPVHLNNTVIRIVERGDVGNKVACGVVLADGTELETDMVIFAVGGQLSTPLAREAGIACEQGGILVNEFMQTNIPNIFAGGDVCMVKDQISGQLVQSCLWTDAIMQGMTAAHGMLGTPKAYPGVLIVTASPIFGTKFVTCGPVTLPNAVLDKQEVTGDGFYHCYFTQNKKLKGFVMVGKIDNVGLLRKKLVDGSEFTVPA